MSMNMEKGQNGLKPVPPTFEKASTIQKYWQLPLLLP